jgi:hypothetical protein
VSPSDSTVGFLRTGTAKVTFHLSHRPRLHLSAETGARRPVSSARCSLLLNALSSMRSPLSAERHPFHGLSLEANGASSLTLLRYQTYWCHIHRVEGHASKWNTVDLTREYSRYLPVNRRALQPDGPLRRFQRRNPGPAFQQTHLLFLLPAPARTTPIEGTFFRLWFTHFRVQRRPLGVAHKNSQLSTKFSS